MDIKDITQSDERKPQQLPKPCGFKILVAIPKSKDTFDSGLVKADTTKLVEETGSVVGYVLEVGPDAYGDKVRFPSGPYCVKGDFVLLSAYRGSRFRVHDQEFRMLNDDQIEAVVEDPTGYRRI